MQQILMDTECVLRKMATMANDDDVKWNDEWVTKPAGFHDDVENKTLIASNVAKTDGLETIVPHLQTGQPPPLFHLHQAEHVVHFHPLQQLLPKFRTRIFF